MRRTRSPSVEMTSTVTSSFFLIVNDTRARSKRPSEFGEKGEIASMSFTGGVRFSR